MKAISTDGTPIAYDRQGAGPALVLVGGGLDDGSENAPLARALAGWFTVYNYARRGRSGSGDTPLPATTYGVWADAARPHRPRLSPTPSAVPYAVEREIEDIAALIAEAGGSAFVYGVSSGGMFALEAAAAGLPIDGLGVYDVPYDPDPDCAARYDEYRTHLAATLAAGRRGDAVALFMGLAGSSGADIEAARRSPFWPGLEALAPTLAYDAALYGPPPADRLATVTQPTLVATGEGNPFFALAADAVAAHVPNAVRRTFDGQGHVADPAVVAPALHQFFTSAALRPP